MANIVGFPARDRSDPAPPGQAAPAQAAAPQGVPLSEPFRAGETFDIWWLLAILRRRAWRLIALVVLITAAAVVVVQALTPTYSADTRIVIESEGASLFDLKSLTGGLVPDSGTIQTEADYLQSRVILGKTVAKLGLADNPEFNPYLRARDNTRMRRLIGRFVDEEMVDAIDRQIVVLLRQVPVLGQPAIDMLYGTAEPLPPRAEQLDATVGTFDEKLDVEASRVSRVITIRFQSSDPEVAAAGANAIAEIYLEDQKLRRQRSLQRASTWLQGRVSGIKEQVVESERALEKFRRKAGIVEIGGATLLRQQLLQINTQLIQATNERAELEARYRQVQDLVGQPDGLDSINAVLNSQLIRDLRFLETQQQQKVAQLGTRLRPGHPDVLQANRELDEIRRSIGAEIDKTARSLKNQVEIARVRERTLSNAVRDAQRELEAQTDSEVTLRALEGEAKSNRDLYASMLTRFKETDAQELKEQTPDARIISMAVLPREPISPKKRVAVIGAFIFGCILAVLLGLLMEFSIRGFKSARQIEGVTGFQVLSSVPLNDDLVGRPPMLHRLTLSRPGAAATQGVRKLRTALNLLTQGSGGCSVLVASSTRGEGRTSLALALAALAVRSGQRALVIDANLDSPGVARGLGVADDFGLAQLLSDRSAVDEAIEFEPVSGIYYVAAGGSVQSAEDAFAAPQMGELMRYARANFDLVLVDSAPVTSSSGALVLAPQVDAVVFVVEWEKTRRDTVLQCLREVHEVGENVAGLVLSKNNLTIQAVEGSADYSDSYYYGAGAET